VKDHVVVIGAGIGGLSAALSLAAKGLQVTVLETAEGPGGKMRPAQVGPALLDTGPTVFTMRWVFEELFEQAGLDFNRAVALQPLSILARHAWRNHAPTLDLHADLNTSADAIARFSSPQEAQRFRAFCKQAREVYHQLEGPHIRSARPNFAQMVADLGPRGLATLAKLGPFATLVGRLEKVFTDPRLQQLFARYATYCGASPWLAPATLMLVAHVEMEGVWSVQGGMGALAQAVATAAQQRGAHLRYGQRCERIELHNHRVAAVHLPGGERLACDAVVFNGDASALAQGLLGAQVQGAHDAVPPRQRSLSALTWALRGEVEGFPLVRHNVFFDDGYAREFDDVFRHRRLPRQGTVYLCAQDRGDAATAPLGGERLLALVNAPADGDAHPTSSALSEEELQSCEQRSLALLAQCGLRFKHPKQVQVLRRSPADFNRLYPGSGGALYGPATHGWMALFKRAGASTAIAGLYLAGGSVHPGPGVPMAAMSGRLAAATLMAHRGSTSRSHRVHIGGGTSMPSATMAPTR
jgi:1-hydroxycarotenoid 3,4-desaturase